SGSSVQPPVWAGCLDAGACTAAAAVGCACTTGTLAACPDDGASCCSAGGCDCANSVELHASRVNPSSTAHSANIIHMRRDILPPCVSTALEPAVQCTVHSIYNTQGRMV